MSRPVKALRIFGPHAPCVATLVGGRVEELLDEIAVRAVQFDLVEARLDGELGRVRVLFDRALDVLGGHRLGRRDLELALAIDPHLAVPGVHGGPEQARAGRHVVGMADAARVHELHEDA